MLRMHNGVIKAFSACTLTESMLQIPHKIATMIRCYLHRLLGSNNNPHDYAGQGTAGKKILDIFITIINRNSNDGYNMQILLQ